RLDSAAHYPLTYRDNALPLTDRYHYDAPATYLFCTYPPGQHKEVALACVACALLPAACQLHACALSPLYPLFQRQ
ncbi:MAG: hypothetical protein ACRC2U_21015, partial [Aeromonas sp.]